MEQYRLFVDTSERLVARRQVVNTFFLSVNTLALPALGLVAREVQTSPLAAIGVVAISPAADRALGALDARFVDQGANLALIEVKSPWELLFREFVNGIWLASAVQVYLDLMRSEGRAREMAKHLRGERIGF